MQIPPPLPLGASQLRKMESVASREEIELQLIAPPEPAVALQRSNVQWWIDSSVAWPDALMAPPSLPVHWKKVSSSKEAVAAMTCLPASPENAVLAFPDRVHFVYELLKDANE